MDLKWLAGEILPRDIIISDLAPQTTGIKLTDTTRSIALAERALEISFSVLRKNGHFVCKIFEGDEVKTFKHKASKFFNQVRLLRPSAVRKGSREVYLLGMKLNN